jgi:ABC-type spermidine/putrescine transport system permease subunit I
MFEISKRLEATVKFTGSRLPTVAILVLFYLPLTAVVVFSFWDRSGLWMEPAFNLDAYLSIKPLLDQLLKSLVLGVVAGLLSVMLAFPVAYYATYKLPDFHRKVLLSILAIPFFVSPFIRITMLIPLIGDNGIINQTLISIGILDQPLTLLFSDVGILIGALITYTPIVIFTGWLSMSMIDKELIDAAKDLRAGPFTAIRTVVIPLAMPGLSIGALFVIASTMGSTVFPVVLGGPSSTSVGLLVQRSFGQLNVPRASAIMVVSSFIYLIGLVLAAQKLKLDKLFDRFQ